MISVGGKKYNWNGQASTQSPLPPSRKDTKVSVVSLLRSSEKEQGFHMPDPKLEEIGQYPKPKQMQGNNLYNFDKQVLRVPEDTSGHMRKFEKTGVDNFALALNKSVHFHSNREGLKPMLFKQGKNEYFQIKSVFSNLLIYSVLERQSRAIYELKEQCLKIKEISLPIQNRLIHGLGNASVFETSMTLHHVYGIPYLPASSIKGVVRSWVIRNCFWKEEVGEDKRSKASEEAAMQSSLFAYIFGKDTSGSDKQAQQGHIIFFDAFPQSPPVIEPDIMNVHYPKYYRGECLPVDYDSPNPVPFLTVGKYDAEGKPLHFKFYIACKERDVKPEITGTMIEKAGGKLSAQSTVLDIVSFWLTAALTSHGIGAKTAVGYGFMTAPQ